MEGLARDFMFAAAGLSLFIGCLCLVDWIVGRRIDKALNSLIDDLRNRQSGT